MQAVLAKGPPVDHKTGMTRLGIPREIRDRVQNHKPQGIGDKAYNFHEYMDEKRDALERWAGHIEKLVLPTGSVPRSRGPDERSTPLRRKAHAFVNLPAALELAATQLLHRGLQVHTEDVRH